MIKILSFNLRYTDDPNGHSIAERAPRVLDTVRACDPDLIGFQEVVPRWMEELAPLDGEYDHLLAYRTEKHPEGTPLYWKKSRYEAVDLKHFWLSQTPAIPSKGWDARLPRICCYAALRDRATGKMVHFFNTHFDWGAVNPTESALTIIHRAESLGGNATVLCTADFNFAPDSSGWHAMRTWFRDARADCAPENLQATLNSYAEHGEEPNRIIDFCFYRGKQIKPVEYQVITKRYGGKFASDHNALLTTFEEV